MTPFTLRYTGLMADVVFRGTLSELQEWLRLQPAWQAQRSIVVYDDEFGDAKPITNYNYETEGLGGT